MKYMAALIIKATMAAFPPAKGAAATVVPFPVPLAVGCIIIVGFTEPDGVIAEAGDAVGIITGMVVVDIVVLVVLELIVVLVALELIVVLVVLGLIVTGATVGAPVVTPLVGAAEPGTVGAAVPLTAVTLWAAKATTAIKRVMLENVFIFLN